MTCGGLFLFTSISSLLSLPLLFQQQVYEVKLEDGSVYVKHSSRLSLQPFPADQKN